MICYQFVFGNDPLWIGIFKTRYIDTHTHTHVEKLYQSEIQLGKRKKNVV